MPACRLEVFIGAGHAKENSAAAGLQHTHRSTSCASGTQMTRGVRPWRPWSHACAPAQCQPSIRHGWTAVCDLDRGRLQTQTLHSTVIFGGRAVARVLLAHVGLHEPELARVEAGRIVLLHAVLDPVAGTHRRAVVGATIVHHRILEVLLALVSVQGGVGFGLGRGEIWVGERWGLGWGGVREVGSRRRCSNRDGAKMLQ
eukprot:363369-Chlamydomonas_euryale.AAC.6